MWHVKERKYEKGGGVAAAAVAKKRHVAQHDIINGSVAVVYYCNDNIVCNMSIVYVAMCNDMAFFNQYCSMYMYVYINNGSIMAVCGVSVVIFYYYWP